MIYFDNASTTELNREIRKNLSKYYDDFYNPSSIHSGGKRAKYLLEKSRKEISKYLNFKDNNMIFCSTATESINIAIKGVLFNSFVKNNNRNKILISKLEHKSVVNAVNNMKDFNFEIEYINVLENGQIDEEDLYKKIDDNVLLISIMSVNNETGVINDISKIFYNIKNIDKNIITHSDITQGLLKKIDYSNIDLISGTFHKIHGPKGVSFLYINKNIELFNLISGGKQEKGYLAGTENLSGILMACDCVKYYYDNYDKISNHFKELKNYLIEELKKFENIYINGSIDNSVDNIINISIKGYKQEYIQTFLDMRDIYIGTSSACNSDIVEKSTVLESMNIKEDLINSSIRISFSIYNNKEEIDTFILALKEMMKNEI